MNISNENYKKYAKDRAGKSPVLKDTCLAFVFGGGICAAAQCVKELYRMAGADEQSLKTWVPCTVIFITAILTGLGLFEKIARHAGAGTLVPISGFANAVVSEALDCKAEGWVLGLGAKVFTIAGPVILYGTASGVVYGVIYYIVTMIGG